MKMIKTIILTCLLLIIIAAQAALPQGKWTVEKVTIEKNTDGDVQTTVYNNATEVKSFIPCMQELEINGQSITLRYGKDWEDTAEYTLDGDQVTINTASGPQTYQYDDTQEGKLTLIAVYNYVNNDLQAKRSEKITEKRIITLTEQK